MTQQELTPLYDVPRNTRIRIPSAKLKLLFHKIDGMYSYCTDDKGEVFHISAYAKVEILDKESQNETKKDLVPGV